MCLILRCFCTGTFSRRKFQGLQRGLLKGRVCTHRLFEILYDNDRLCLSNIIRLRYFEILETGYVFTFIRVIFLTLILWIIWEVITGNWGPSGNKLRKEEGWWTPWTCTAYLSIFISFMDSTQHNTLLNQNILWIGLPYVLSSLFPCLVFLLDCLLCSHN